MINIPDGGNHPTLEKPLIQKMICIKKPFSTLLYLHLSSLCDATSVHHDFRVELHLFFTHTAIPFLFVFSSLRGTLATRAAQCLRARR